MQWTRTLILALFLLLVAGTGFGQALEEAAIFIEINDTDGDAGLQLFLDGEGWDRFKLVSPDREILLNIRATGGVGLQGLTEGFFESAEPSFDEQPLGEFLGLFPEGEYKFIARSTEGEWTRVFATLTHALPGAPVITVPSEDEVFDDPDDVMVEWMPVADPPGSSIVRYEVIVERDDDDAPAREFFADVDPDQTSIEVPEEFLDDGPYKAEVLAVEESGNKTITEVEFHVGEEDEDDDEDDDDEEDEDEDEDDEDEDD